MPWLQAQDASGLALRRELRRLADRGPGTAPVRPEQRRDQPRRRLPLAQGKQAPRLTFRAKRDARRPWRDARRRVKAGLAYARRGRRRPCSQCGPLGQCCVVSAEQEHDRRAPGSCSPRSVAVVCRCLNRHLVASASSARSTPSTTVPPVIRVMYPQRRACGHVSISIWSMSSATRTGWGRDRPPGPRGRTRRRVGKTSPAKCRWSLQ